MNNIGEVLAVCVAIIFVALVLAQADSACTTFFFCGLT